MILAALTWLASVCGYSAGRATVFDRPEVDAGNVGGHACELGERVNARSPLALRLYRAGLLVAHRSLPCWTVIALCLPRTGRCSLATVADRWPRRAAIDRPGDAARRQKGLDQGRGQGGRARD